MKESLTIFAGGDVFNELDDDWAAFRHCGRGRLRLRSIPNWGAMILLAPAIYFRCGHVMAARWCGPAIPRPLWISRGLPA